MAFPRFGELPLELQDLIWEFCIPNPPPAAHFTHLRSGGIHSHAWGKRLPEKQEPSLVRSRTLEVATERYRGLDRPIALQTLLRTTSRSRTVALRQADSLAPIVPAILGEGDVATSNKSQTPIPEQRINAVTDLVILEEGWYLELCEVPGMIFYKMQSPEPLHYLAFPYFGTDEGELGTGLNGLLAAYHQLKVLYILIDPDELRASEQPWVEVEREEPDWSDEEEAFAVESVMPDDGIFSLEAYLAAYVEGSIRPGPFRCRRREYFEVPAEEIRSLGGLQNLIEEVDKTRIWRGRNRERKLVANMVGMVKGKTDTCSGKEPMRFRLLSWRDV